MKVRASAQHSSLSALFPSPAMARLVVFFLVHPGGRFWQAAAAAGAVRGGFDT